MSRKGNEMIDEKSKYKSWSNLKKQMNDLLCDSLKGKITYFYTNYHEVHNAYGRATINFNKKELVAFSWVEMYEQDQDIDRLWQEGIVALTRNFLLFLLTDAAIQLIQKIFVSRYLDKMYPYLKEKDVQPLSKEEHDTVWTKTKALIFLKEDEGSYLP